MFYCVQIGKIALPDEVRRVPDDVLTDRLESVLSRLGSSLQQLVPRVGRPPKDAKYGSRASGSDSDAVGGECRDDDDDDY